MNAPVAPDRFEFVTNSPEETAKLAQLFADHARDGTTILLDGNLGAGKSHFARSYIQHLMTQAGDMFEVPSPTFTLVQTYQINMLEIWHADLYRLSFFEELVELGLDTALDRATCLIEWPDRLGPISPPSAATVHLKMLEEENARQITVSNTVSLPPELTAELAKFSAV